MQNIVALSAKIKVFEETKNQNETKIKRMEAANELLGETLTNLVQDEQQAKNLLAEDDSYGFE